MKKQIFKLTSILLAMVMVFTMFTIVPISAEETTVDKATAVKNFKEAWEALDYIADEPTHGIYYLNGVYGSKNTGISNYIIKDDTAPEFSDTNYSFNFPAAPPLKIMYTADSDIYPAAATSQRIPMNNCDIVSGDSDLYFYYKTDAGVEATYTVDISVGFTDGKNNNPYAGWTGLTLNSTNGNWEKVSLKNWVNNTEGIALKYEEVMAAKKATPYISRLYLALTPTSETSSISFTELGFEGSNYDKNLCDTFEYTDDQWLDKAATLDLETLKAEYDTTDSAKWDAFVAAYNVVKPYFTEKKLREAAEEMITSEKSYAYPIQRGRDILTEMIDSANAVDIFGDKYTVQEFVGQNEITNMVGEKAVWMQTKYIPSNNDSILFGEMGDPYFTINVIELNGASSAKLDFFIRVTGTNSGDYYCSYEPEIVEGGTYKIYMSDVIPGLFKGSTKPWTAENWKDAFSTGGSIGNLFCIGVKGTGVTATIKMGSLVDAPNYSIPADIAAKSGSDFVAEMGVLDISKYGNTEAFNAALKAALDAHPEAARYVAVENLRKEAGKLYVVNSFAYPNRYTGDKNAEGFAENTEHSADYGSHTATLTLPFNASSNRSTGVWYSPNYTTGTGKEHKYFGDYGEDSYITINVSNVEVHDGYAPRIVFWMRPENSSNTHDSYFKKYIDVSAGNGEYKIKLKDLFTGGTVCATDGDGGSCSTKYRNWPENNMSTCTTENKYSVYIFIVAAYGADITATIGSIVYPTYFPISEYDNLVDVEFVKAMKAFKEGDSYASYSNTAEFKEALEVALEAFPEIEEEEAKKAALDKLRAEWVDMIESTPTIDTTYTHDRFWNASKAYAYCSTVDAGKYGKAFTAMGITSTVPEFGIVEGGSPTENLLLIHDKNKSKTLNGIGALDIGFWYKSTGDINVRTYLMFGNKTYAPSVGEVVLNGDDEWHFYSYREAMGEANWATTVKDNGASPFHRYYIDLGNVVEPEKTSVDVTFGGAAFRIKDTTVAAIDDADLVAEAIKVNTDNYADATAFEAALTAALTFYPEVEEELAKEKAIEELRAAAKELYAYGNSFFVPGKTYSYSSNGGEDLGNKRYSVTLEPSTDPAYGDYTVDVNLPAKTSASAEGLWFTTLEYANKDAENTVYIGGDYDDATFTVKVNDVSAAGTYLAFRVRGNSTGYDAPSTYTKAIEKDGEYEISLNDIFASTALKNWQESSTADYKGDKYTLTFISMAAVGGNADVTVGSIQYKNVPTISDAKGVEFLKEMYVLDADAYLNNENFKAKRAAAVELFGEDQVVSAKKAQSVINAASDLRTLGLKPDVYALRGSGTRYNHIYDASENGDSYITIDTNELGNDSCEGNAGYVEYVPVTASGKLTLADLKDLSFAYKTANVTSGTEISARVYITMEYDDENKALVGRDHFASRYNSTQSVVRLGVTEDKWQTFSFADDLGDWRAWLLEAYTAGQNSDLAEGDPAGTYTYDDVNIINIRLGFNQTMLADISLGSMYISADNDYNITATYLEETDVLAKAREFNLTGVNKADADEFKALVKDLETAINAEAVDGNFVSGNYGGAVSLVDLSVLAQYVDGELEDTFIDLDCADINGDGEINKLDVEMLRKSLLGIPDES